MRGAVIALSLGAASASTLREHSFAPPFAAFDSEGHRQIPNWRNGGSTELATNYARITNDKQARKGWLWATNSMASQDSWTATLRFRISGQGKKLFGDGLAIWFTTQAVYREGPAHGFTDTFKGFGVILDTYVNMDPGHVHKDVLLLSSDGKAPKLAPHGGPVDPHPTGCDADFRYWEGRGDFNVTSRSSLRIRFADNKVSIWIDPRNDGKVKECVKDVPVSAEHGWWRAGAYMGISATTGDLADNHDVLSLILTDEDAWAAEDSIAPAVSPVLSSGSSAMDASIESYVAREAASMNDKLSTMHHQLEHNFASVSDGLKSAVKKLQDQESALEKRLLELESRLTTKVLETVDTNVNSHVQRKLSDVLLPSIEARLAASGGAWRIPFVVLLIVILALSAVALNRYRKLMKSHFL